MKGRKGLAESQHLIGHPIAALELFYCFMS